MEIDVILDTRAPAEELAALGRLAEQHGIRGVWVSSLLDSRDPFTNLVSLAQTTSQITLGPIAVNPYDAHPVRIASAFLTLNELAGGRARLVIGGGGEALEALDIKPERRVRTVAECVEIIAAAATGEAVNYDGKIFRVRNLALGWRTAPPPPIYVGASQTQMLRMSARVADGIMMSDMPDRCTQRAVGILDEGLVAAGKTRADFETSAFAAWHVYDDRERASAEARQWLLLRGIFRPWLLREFLAEEDVELVMSKHHAFVQAFRARSPDIEGVPDRVLDALVDNITFCGDLGEIDRQIERLRRLAAAGLSSIALRLYQDPAASIRLLGEQVIPNL